MKRLGKFSGKIYEESEICDMHECGICISDENAENSDWIAKRHTEDLKDCLVCMGCPQSQK